MSPHSHAHGAHAHDHDDDHAHDHTHGGGHDHAHAHGHAHDHAVAVSDGNKGRVLLAAILTCVFMVAEVAGGLLTGSLALIADAGHMLTDAVALVLAWVAYKAAERPGTSRMTYGFDRLKVLVAFVNGLAVFAIAAWIAVEAAQRLYAPQSVLGLPMLAVAGAGLVVNVAVFAILSGGDRSSLNLRGAILHVLGDLLGSVAAIVAALVILATGWTPADPILSVLVSVLLLVSAWRLVRESGLVLLEGAPAHVDRNAVAADLAGAVPGILDVHHMHVWTLDGRAPMATLHARLAPGTDAAAAIAAVKMRLRTKHAIDHATVEIETGAACPDHGHEDRSARAT